MELAGVIALMTSVLIVLYALSLLTRLTRAIEGIEKKLDRSPSTPYPTGGEE